MSRQVQPRNVVNYQEPNGHEPFEEWFNQLRDPKTKQRILARLYRLEQGNFGDHASLGSGIGELRLFYGPGYRIYYAEEGNRVVILLGAGDKSSQSRDIRRARERWEAYQKR